MQTIEQMNANVGPLVAAHSETAHEVDHRAELEKAVDAIESMPTDLLHVDATKAAKMKSEAAQRAVNFYLSQKIATAFPRVNHELIARKRWIRCEASKSAGWSIVGESLEDPKEFTTRAKDSDGKVLMVTWATIPLLLIDGGSRRGGHSSHVSIAGFGDYWIRATPPVVPMAAHAVVREAIAIVLQAYADALRIRRVAGIVQSLIEHDHRNAVVVPSCRVAWIPLLSELQLQKRPPDPAMLLEFGEHYHLVTHWDAPGERPLENILREYTEGRFVPAVDDDDE